MNSKLQFTNNKNIFGAFIISGILLLASIFYYKGNQNKTENTPNKIEFTNEEKGIIDEFDPNELDEKQWRKLGFSEKQVATILKYKNIVGGNFTSKQQLKKCYAISDEKFSEIEQYMLLPEKFLEKNNAQSFQSNYKSYTKKELKIPGKFNPDGYSENDFVKMGFSENQARAILKYKKYLGGSFLSKEKFKECFIISEVNYSKMAPFLLLPEKSSENSKQNFTKNSENERPKTNYHDFDPNVTDLEGWKRLGFSEKQAQVIVNYRDKNLKGSFKSLEDLKNCFVISEEKFNEMEHFINLNPSNFVAKTPLNYTKIISTETKTDFTKVDLNQITFRQLTEFGFTEKDAAMLLSFRKKLGGFVNKQQIIDAYEIDKELAQKLINKADFDASKVTKYTLIDAPEDWLKNHPYFKYSADKIIYFRMSNPDEKKIWKFIKVKPEYEAKMRMYLK